MTPIDDNQDQDDQQDDTMSQLPTRDLRALRAAAKRGSAYAAERKEMEERMERLAETNNFLRAGVDPSSTDPMVKLFFQGFDGDTSDPGAIRAAAEELGIVHTATLVPTEELRQHQVMMNASAGSDGDTSNEPDIRELIAKAPTAEAVMELLRTRAPQVPTTRNRY